MCRHPLLSLRSVGYTRLENPHLPQVNCGFLTFASLGSPKATLACFASAEIKQVYLCVRLNRSLVIHLFIRFLCRDKANYCDLYRPINIGWSIFVVYQSFITFAAQIRFIAARKRGGKSEQHRAPHKLTA